MTDPTFVLSFKNDGNDATRNCFNKYYMPLVKIKDFNVLNYHKPFFDQSIKVFNSRYFCGKSHFENDGTQNYLVFLAVFRCFTTVANTSKVTA